LGLAAAAAVLLGLVSGWWTPRGPVTTTEALAAIGLGLLVGGFAGRVMRSRWAMLLAPVVFVGTFELVRAGTSGPLVDGIHLGSTLGILAFVLGRGLHGILVLLPMLLGVALGAALSRRRDGTTPVRHGWAGVFRWARVGVTVLVALGVVALAAGISRPASTDPITGPGGEAIDGSIAELSTVDVEGHELALMIRGSSMANPVLLHLAGGPGGSDVGAMRLHGGALEDAFTVVTLDQRGAGKSYPALDPTSTLTADAAVQDVITVTEHLRDRFGQDKIYLLGNSWGTLVGVLAAQQHPELFRAFIGAGQMVSIRETDQMFYTDTLAWARSTGRTGLAETLTANGPPPYSDVRDYEPVTLNEGEVNAYDHSHNAEGAGGFSESIFVQEYSLMEKLHVGAAALDVLVAMYPGLQNIDLRVDVPRLEVPVYLVQGRYEARGRAEPAEQWFAALSAPSKQLVVLATSGHRPLFEQPEQFATVMTETVLAQTRTGD